jgi:hypothetical protein
MGEKMNIDTFLFFPLSVVPQAWDRILRTEPKLALEETHPIPFLPIIDTMSTSRQQVLFLENSAAAAAFFPSYFFLSFFFYFFIFFFFFFFWDTRRGKSLPRFQASDSTSWSLISGTRATGESSLDLLSGACPPHRSARHHSARLRLTEVTRPRQQQSLPSLLFPPPHPLPLPLPPPPPPPPPFRRQLRRLLRPKR